MLADVAPNDTYYKRFSCNSGFGKLLWILFRHLTPQQWGPIYRFFVMKTSHADPLDGWHYPSQRRALSRQIQVRQPHANKSGFSIFVSDK